jgi:hypothetical protein
MLASTGAILFPFMINGTSQCAPTDVGVAWLRRQMESEGGVSLICHPLRPQHSATGHPLPHTRDLAPLFYERAAAILFTHLILEDPPHSVVELAVYGPRREPVGLFFDGVSVKPAPLSQVKYRL